MLENKELIVEPLEDYQIQPASIDLTLGNEFLKINSNPSVIEMDEPVPYVKVESDEFLIMPQQFVLATTNEYIEIPNGMSAFVEGRSSIGRMGLFVQNAGWVDTGFKGNITLELYNANKNVPVVIKSGRRICQLVLASMDDVADNPYNGKYQLQQGTWGSLIDKDEELKGGE